MIQLATQNFTLKTGNIAQMFFSSELLSKKSILLQESRML